ncbi:MAG: tetratricopeptide repeat protein [Acidimicrobiia bacterium]|nr:tetratricopeptide repeat protein [Acidimicrobiia bacterium]
MQSRFTSLRVFVLVLLVGVSASACGKYSIGNLRMLMSFKEGNVLYGKADFTKAAQSYEEAVKHNPDFGIVYFFLANSYDNLSTKSSGDAREELLQKAVDNYNKAITVIKDEEPSGAQIRKLSYEYLIAAYGPDKLNDFTHAEPIAKKLIEMEPSEPSNYRTMGDLYEKQGMYEEAEAYFLKSVEVRPTDALGFSVLAGYYNRQGNFEKTMEAWENRAKAEPNNPEAHHTIAHWLWEKAFKDYTITNAQKRAFIERALAAEDTALGLHADYVEALTYKNILLRMKAGMERDRKVIDALIAEADRLRNRAMELSKAQAAGGGI